ncbi:MAG: enoyl-[acyl-carrier-protein] reductase [NADH] [Phycisphaerae bacterium]|nr:MAG: enoyl-[acyl-carrier-protein] reductase [NADH] [Phycisphaerae bacterium]
MALLAGKSGLIIGIANDRSYAWHIAKAFLEHGATCAFTHLPGERSEHRTRRAIESLGVTNPWLVPMDAGKDEDIATAFEKYAAAFPRMDFLVHSIAFADRDILSPGKFINTTRAQYTSAVDISAYTLLAFARAARPIMARSGGGSIMGMSYYGADKVVPGYNVMGVAKAALECTGRYLASELGPDKIRVNLISGGYLRTLAASAVAGTDSISERVEQQAPLRRNVEGADVGKTAVYLASDLSSGVTGETVFVDCGVNILGA